MFDIRKICSLCGSTENIMLYDVFEPEKGLDEYSETLPFRIKSILQIEVVQGDMICHSCLYEVNSFHFFKCFSRQTYKSLHKTLGKFRPTPDNKTDADGAIEEVQVLEEKIQEQAMVELPKQEFAPKPVTVSEGPETAGATKAALKTPVTAGVSKTERKVVETGVGALKVTQKASVTVGAPKALETVLNDIPGSSGTSGNSTNQRAPVNNNEPVRKGKRPSASPPARTSAVRIKCHDEQHAASLEFRNELIQVNNALAPHEEPILNQGKCNVCLKFFGTTYLLKRHLVSHSSLRPFACQMCSKTFKDHSYLVKHERVHLRSSTKQLTCVYCDLPFTVKSNLDRHLKNVHYVDSKSDSDVEVTAQVVTNNSGDRESSSSPDYPVVCRLCLRTFRDVEGLNMHRAAHEKDIFQCDECPETFSEQSNLEKHRNYLHAVCETCLCPKLYECCCDSKRRKRTVNKLTCAQCSRSFPDTFVLTMHLRGCRKPKKIVDKEIVLID